MQTLRVQKSPYWVLAILFLLIISSDGLSQTKLWGLTGGGTISVGGVFSIVPGETNLSDTYLLNTVTDGKYPKGSLVKAGNGKLYGVTFLGGTNNYGTLFEYDQVSNMYTRKHLFDFTHGAQPVGDLVEAPNGKLYGLCSWGIGPGPNGSGNGSIFEYDYINDVFQTKIYFDGINTGGTPNGSLTVATDGKLYGLTQGGGFNQNGVLFSYNYSLNQLTPLFYFDRFTTGAGPMGSLMQAANGKLYGTTQVGGFYDRGTIFEFDPGIISTPFDNPNLAFHKLLDFNSDNGSYPYGSVIEATDGFLYGCTSSGGGNFQGTLFRFNRSNNSIK